MHNDGRLRLDGLSELEILELEAELGPNAVVQVTRDPIGHEGAHGDLGASTVLLILAPAVLTGLATWLAKKRVRVEELSELQATIQPNGAVAVRMTVKRSALSSEPPSPEFVKALSAGLGAVVEQARKVTSAYSQPGGRPPG